MLDGMTNIKASEVLKEIKYYTEDLPPYSPDEVAEALEMAIKALEQQQDVHDTCIEDYPTCTECEHYDKEKHYCPRFCQVIKDALAEAQPSEDCRNCKKWDDCECGRKGHINGTSIGYSIGECKDYEPCEDCISRQAVINTIFYKSDNSCDVVLSTDLMDRIKQLPSVTPRTNLAETSQDCINRQAVIDHICEDKECYTEECKGRTLKRCPDLQWVLDLPSVTPQRPKGKWIIFRCGDTDTFKCSECGMRVINPYKYCPNCGSYNGGEEDADSN